jgi:RimJ/RimL family protein N-acetyltransferase
MSSIWAGKTIRLRAAEPEDERIFAEFHAHSGDQRNGGMVQPPIAVGELSRSASEQPRHEPGADSFRLTIESTIDAAVVGGIATQNPDPRFGNFSYGLIIGQKHQKRGYATEAITILLAYMFGECRYHKCEVSIYEFNTGSIALHRKLGFTEEGRLRDHVYSSGSFHDMIMMGMTADEFARRHPFHQF